MAMQQLVACVLLVQGKPLLHCEGMPINQHMNLQFPLDSASTVMPEISFQGALLQAAPVSCFSAGTTSDQAVDLRSCACCSGLQTSLYKRALM